MQLTVTNLYTRSSFRINGDENTIKGTLVSRIPWLKKFADQPISKVLKYLERQQNYAIEVQGTEAEKQALDLYPASLPPSGAIREDDTPQEPVEDSELGKLPDGLVEFWQFPEQDLG